MKKLNLSEMALAAEILGGVAVVVTLVFLVLATRENTNAIQAQTYQALTAELNAIRLAYTTSDVADNYVLLPTEGIQALSDGERSRLQLALLVLSGANFLLLDEPTNNLDIASAEVLEQALEDFVGTVLVISHDRYFLDRTVERLLAIENRQLVEYLGGYSDYLEKQR